MKMNQIISSKESLPTGWKLSLKKGIGSKIYTKSFNDKFFGTVELSGNKAICTLSPVHDTNKKPMWSKVIKLNKPDDLIKSMKLVNTMVERINAKKEGSK